MTVTSWPSLPGAYILLIQVDAPFELSAGSLKRAALPAGLYAYVGSAHGPGGLHARLSRHARPDKSLRWHVDYMTSRAPITGILAIPGSDRSECAVLQSLLAIDGAWAPARGFGSSDCRSGCPAHLLRLPDGLATSDLKARLGL